nr:hypothetical protein [Tanacetum cinerariifolium]
DWEIHTEGKREYWKIIRVGGHTGAYQFFIDMLKQFDREDLHQLWILGKETFSIKQSTRDKEKELWSKMKSCLKHPLQKKEPEQEYILIPICTTDSLISQGPKDSAVDAEKKDTKVDESQVSDNGGQDDQVTRNELEGLHQQERQTGHIKNTNSFNTVSSPVNTAGPSFVNTALPSPINVAGTLASTNTFKEHPFG